MKINIQRLPHAANLPLPSYATEGSAGLDLHAAIPTDLIIGSGKRVLVPTGFAIQLPQGYEAQIRSRSGLALKHGLFVLNSPATIDSDYRGEIFVLIMNTDDDAFVITPGMRFAQMIITTYTAASFFEVDTLTETERGLGKFGSTGV
ncbi:MAG: dUTP diphosphatase [Pseudomonadota bacterium]|jgi:dUTP pyrophosphatase|nr:dUTP diphosphatase [Alphaproteobacteria bacterium]MDP5370464.1 dUTP diphosphatase [Pseudomonadota bacterium]